MSQLLQEAVAEINRQEKHDPVKNPAHYADGPIECLDAIEVAINGLDGIKAHLTACCIRYLWRWDKKNGIEDLQKCEEYLKRLISTALIDDAQNIGLDYERPMRGKK